MTKTTYDCSKCPGYCCAYPVITVTKRDIERIARHLALSPEQAEAKFCRKDHGYKRIIRRKTDEHFGRICRFFDSGNRNCSIYKARPAACRNYPGEGRCGYYDFLTFERSGQKDEDYIATTWHNED